MANQPPVPPHLPRVRLDQGQSRDFKVSWQKKSNKRQAASTYRSNKWPKVMDEMVTITFGLAANNHGNKGKIPSLKSQQSLSNGEKLDSIH